MVAVSLDEHAGGHLDGQREDGRGPDGFPLYLDRHVWGGRTGRTAAAATATASATTTNWAPVQTVRTGPLKSVTGDAVRST